MAVTNSLQMFVTYDHGIKFGVKAGAYPRGALSHQMDKLFIVKRSSLTYKSVGDKKIYNIGPDS
jgi:hypothetical protein